MGHQLQFISIKFLLHGPVLLLLVTKFLTTAKYVLSFVFLVLLHHSLLKSTNHFIKMIKVINLTLFHLIHGFTDLIVTVVLVLLVRLLILFISNLLLTHALVPITQNHVLITVFSTIVQVVIVLPTELAALASGGRYAVKAVSGSTVQLAAGTTAATAVTAAAGTVIDTAAGTAIVGDSLVARRGQCTHTESMGFVDTLDSEDRPLQYPHEVHIGDRIRIQGTAGKFDVRRVDAIQR